MKKIISFVLLAAMLITTLSACGGEQVSLLNFIGQEFSDDDLDFNGYEFVIRQNGVIEYGDSVVGDAILQRYKDVGKLFNMNIQVVETENLDPDAELFLAKASGLKFCDLWQLSNEYIYECYLANLILPYNTFDGLDLNSGVFGSEGMLEAIRFQDGNIYGIQAELWPTMPDIGMINFVCYNPLLISTYNLENPQELVENDKWDWGTFRDMAVNATILSDEKYGIISEHDDFAINAIYSNDGDIVKYNETTGKYYYGLLDDEAIEALEWSQMLSLEDQCLYIEQSSMADNWMFTEGDALFWVTSLGYVFSQNEETSSPLIHMKGGYDWAPFPYGPNNEDHSWNPKSNMYTNYYALVDHADFDESIVIPTLNKLFQPIEDQIAWKEYYTEFMITGNDRSREIFIELLDEITSSNLHVFTISDRVDNFKIKDLLLRNESVVELVQSTSDILQARIDEAFNN